MSMVDDLWGRPLIEHSDPEWVGNFLAWAVSVPDKPALLRTRWVTDGAVFSSTVQVLDDTVPTATSVTDLIKVEYYNRVFQPIIGVDCDGHVTTFFTTTPTSSLTDTTLVDAPTVRNVQGEKRTYNILHYNGRDYDTTDTTTTITWTQDPSPVTVDTQTTTGNSETLVTITQSPTDCPTTTTTTPTSSP